MNEGFVPEKADYVTAVVFIANQCRNASHDSSSFDHLCSSDRQMPADVLADIGILARQENYAQPYLWKMFSAEEFVSCAEANIENGPSYNVVLCALTFSFFSPAEEHVDFLVNQGVFEPKVQTSATLIGTNKQPPALTAKGRKLESLSLEWPWTR